MRSAQWLEAQLDSLLKGSFSDLSVVNRLDVHWGRRAQRRFGSIKMRPDARVSVITVNGLFRDEKIPEQIVQATLAHELSHYAHGFSSPLPRKYKSPHAGGVIEREFRKRGLGLLSAYEKQWTKNHWPKVLEEAFPRRSRSLALKFLKFVLQ
ncbi:hypothetical protein IPG41_01310 [Candidatus Peregrinibacteria bacterium]|nr:MAG: hypothetical protein IPG41_01310 [Candidatus Peregrinibacteria bacterium]